jgi:hypothetical protein
MCTVLDSYSVQHMCGRCVHSCCWTTSVAVNICCCCFCVSCRQRSCLDPDAGTLPTRRASSNGRANTADVQPTTGAQLPEACTYSNMTRPDAGCADALLLALTPGKYSSNSTADTPGHHAFISPVQVGGCWSVAQSTVFTCFNGSKVSVLKHCRYTLCRTMP